MGSRGDVVAFRDRCLSMLFVVLAFFSVHRLFGVLHGVVFCMVQYLRGPASQL